eukprot:sb/3469601/
MKTVYVTKTGTIERVRSTYRLYYNTLMATIVEESVNVLYMTGQWNFPAASLWKCEKSDFLKLSPPFCLVRLRDPVLMKQGQTRFSRLARANRHLSQPYSRPPNLAQDPSGVNFRLTPSRGATVFTEPRGSRQDLVDKNLHLAHKHTTLTAIRGHVSTDHTRGISNYGINPCTGCRRKIPLSSHVQDVHRLFNYCRHQGIIVESISRSYPLNCSSFCHICLEPRHDL